MLCVDWLDGLSPVIMGVFDSKCNGLATDDVSQIETLCYVSPNFSAYGLHKLDIVSDEDSRNCT